MPLPAYPASLTQNELNKIKTGMLAKLFPASLGDAIKNAENAFKAVSWDNIFKKPPEGSTLKAINDQIAKAGSETKEQTNKLKHALNELKMHASELKQKWGASKLYPKNVTTYIENVVKAIDPFIVKVDTEIKAGMQSLFAMQKQRTEGESDESDSEA